MFHPCHIVCFQALARKKCAAHPLLKEPPSTSTDSTWGNTK